MKTGMLGMKMSIPGRGKIECTGGLSSRASEMCERPGCSERNKPGFSEMYGINYGVLI